MEKCSVQVLYSDVGMGDIFENDIRGSMLDLLPLPLSD